VWAPLALAALVVAQVAWAWDRTPELFNWEPNVRQEARAEAAAYLAATTGPRDVLLGYDPLFLQAWEQNADFPLLVLPRADTDLALHNLLKLDRPLGDGVWVFDASKTTNFERSLEIPRLSPRPAAPFEVRDFGPFLVIRTRAPVLTPDRYLLRAGQAMLVGKRLFLGDADINLPTIERAARALRGYGASRSLSTSSR
jgi:hypothetical protein